jgi:hypothetical protein
VQDSNLRPLLEGQPSYRWTNGPLVSLRKVEGSNPGPLGPRRSSNRVPATPTAPSNLFIASPVRFERTTPAFGEQCSVPLSYDELAPKARFKLTTEASRASVLFTTPPGSDHSAGALRSDAYGTQTRTSRIDGPALVQSSSRVKRDVCP